MLNNKQINVKEEKFHFSIFYVIGILMVVCRHSGAGEFIFLNNEWISTSTFMLFIFLFSSGYFFTNNINKKPIDIIINKTKKLIIPLYIWHFIYGILVLIFKQINLIDFGKDFNLFNLILNPLYSTHAFFFNKGAWFLVPLFIIQVGSIIFLPLLKKKHGSYVIFILYLLLGMCGVYLFVKGYNYGIPLVIGRILYFLPFFALGILYKEKLEKHDKINNTLYFLIIILIHLFLIFIKGGVKEYIPFDGAFFDDIISPFIYGFLGVAFWFRISKILVPSLKNSKVVKFISKNTFDIMMHHMLGFFVLNLIWCILSSYLPFIEGFDIGAFKTNISYRYLPNGIQQFNFLYLLFGLVISIIISTYTKEVNLIIKKYISKMKVVGKNEK